MTELTDTERETCPTACVEFNHPGREHDEWIGSIRILGALAGYKAAEEDAAILTARLARVEALADKWQARAEKATREGLGPQTIGATFAVRSLRAALAAPTPDEDQP